MVFIHAGQEFLRTKNGEENSYRSPDSVNVFDYDRAGRFANEVRYFKDLNAFRKTWPWLRESDYEVIKASAQLITAKGLHLSYRVAGAFGTGRDALVMINANYSSWHHSLPAGTYKVHINDGVVHSDPKAQEINKKLVVPPLRLAVVEHIN